MCEQPATGHRRASWLCRPPPASGQPGSARRRPAVPAGGLGDVTRGDLDQPRNGAAEQPGEPYPDHPETSPRNPALPRHLVLREESSADGPVVDLLAGYRPGGQPGRRIPGEPGGTGD